MYEYLKDSEFLQKLENMNIKIQYIKLIMLDFAEKPIREIQGQAQSGGTINVNGSSSLRRTISFTMFADINTNDLTNIDNLISLNDTSSAIFLIARVDSGKLAFHSLYR